MLAAPIGAISARRFLDQKSTLQRKVVAVLATASIDTCIRHKESKTQAPCLSCRRGIPACWERAGSEAELPKTEALGGFLFPPPLVQHRFARGGLGTSSSPMRKAELMICLNGL
jgi:hypothetical protein